MNNSREIRTMEEKKSLTESELYNIGASMCARTEHCSAEVRSKLLRGTDDDMGGPAAGIGLRLSGHPRGR